MRSRVVFENEPVRHLRIAYPSALLRHIIEYYFEICTANTPQAIHYLKGIPAVNTLLCFQLNATPWTSFTEKNNASLHIQTSQLLGHITRTFNSAYAPGTHLFFVKLKPGVSSWLFRCEAAELENEQAELAYLLQIPSLEDQLRDVASFSERVQLFERMYLQYCPLQPRDTYRFGIVQYCIQKYESLQLKDEKGLLYLCKQLHVTYASLRRYFLATVGVTPGYAQKTIRFKKALHKYRYSGYNFHYEDFGYTDFPHFVKDARALTGCSPLEL